MVFDTDTWEDPNIYLTNDNQSIFKYLNNLQGITIANNFPFENSNIEDENKNLFPTGCLPKLNTLIFNLNSSKNLNDLFIPYNVENLTIDGISCKNIEGVGNKLK